MANHKHAKKMIRKIARRTAVNKARMSRIRTFVKKVEVALGMYDKKEANAATAKDALRIAEGELMQGVKHGLIHKNAAARKVSRLARRVKDLSLASVA